MASDPGLSNDTCIFMAALPGDEGNHNPHDIWWLSPDISLIGPNTGADNADSGQTNSITVSFHRKPVGSSCTFPGDESLNVEVWVANPSLIMSPRLPSSASRVGFIGAPVPGEGNTGTQQFDWDAPASPPAGDPQSGGHKCLVARAYPSSATPSTASFFVPGDQHVAQHNLCVAKTSSGRFSFRVNTFGTKVFHPTLPPLQPPPNAHLRAVLDLHPSTFVRETVLNRLAAFPGFQHLHTTPLNGGFKFDLTNLHATHIVDHSNPPALPTFPPQANPSFEANVALDAHHITAVPFAVNLKGMPSGDACIFHLIQIGLDSLAEGGLTLVILKT
jgi:hypothetical protein